MNKSILWVLMLGLVLISCEDYLEQPVDQRAQIDNVEKVSELLVSAYPKADYATFTEALSDMALDKGAGSVVIEEENVNPYFFEDVKSNDEGSPHFYWNACYAAIAAANHALEAIENAPNPAEYSAQKGEALVARAYAHFMLVTIFSKVYDPATASSDPGIPYVTKPEKVVMQQYERKTVAFVYEQIEKDIHAGMPLINDNAYRVPKYHFNKSAAHAFAARFYLFKRDYANVIDQANKVFAGGNIEANLRPWIDVYANLTANEGEAIYTKASENSNLLLVETESVWARNYARYRFGFATPLLNYYFRSANVTGASWGFPIYSFGDDNWFILKFREHFVRSDVNANIGFAYTIFPLFTAEEVLFNRAEAYISLGYPELAKADLNLYASKRIENYDAQLDAVTDTKVKEFYNTNDLQVGLMATLLDFKAAEFVHEGMRWFDILRHDIPVVHPTENGQVYILPPGDPRRVMQLPQEAVLAGLELNPRPE